MLRTKLVDTLMQVGVPDRTPASTVDRAGVLSSLRKILPADAVLSDTEDLYPYECDGLSAYRQIPLAVVLPDNVAQVQQILRLCSEHGIPVVARGAGTGLSGGALPLADGVLLSLAKFNRIRRRICFS